MPLTPQQESTLFDLLTDVGWRWSGEILDAPYGTMWLSHPAWQLDLEDFYQRMVRRCERIEANRTANTPLHQFYRTHFDTLTLVNVLRTLLELESS